MLSISDSSWNITVFCFSFGHFLNGMCAGTWFSYLLVFLNGALRLKSIPAGIIMFSGQVFIVYNRLLMLYLHLLLVLFLIQVKE